MLCDDKERVDRFVALIISESLGSRDLTFVAYICHVIVLFRVLRSAVKVATRISAPLADHAGLAPLARRSD